MPRGTLEKKIWSGLGFKLQKLENIRGKKIVSLLNEDMTKI